jgi:hypothetical protein
MKELNFTENIIFLFGAVLMVAGSAANIFVQPWAPYTFAAGAMAFAAMQMKQRYEGKNFVIRRLRRIVIVSDVFFLLSALLMFANQANFFGLDFLLYIKYVHNNWVITLLVAAILQLYATHRISNELEKEAKKL